MTDDDPVHECKSDAEPSAKEALEGKLGDIDQIVMMLMKMESMAPGTTPMGQPPLPGSSPGAGPATPSPAGAGMGGPPMGPLPAPPPGPGPMPGPSPMPMGMLPPHLIQQELQSARGLV